MAGLMFPTGSSSDDELKPVAPRCVYVKRESSTASDEYDPMKRKLALKEENDHSPTSPLKKIKTEQVLPALVNEDGFALAAHDDASMPVDSVETSQKISLGATKLPRDKRRVQKARNGQDNPLVKEEPARDALAEPNLLDTKGSEDQESSAFTILQASLYVPLSPISQLHPLPGICAEHLSPLILTYFPPFQGLILAYENPKLSNRPDAVSPGNGGSVFARCLDEYGASYVWVTADFLLFVPRRGCELEGWISLQTESQISLVVWNYFNASISRERLPPTWTWVSTERDHHQTLAHVDSTGDTMDEGNSTGYFCDEQGDRVKGLLKFRIADIDLMSDLYREKTQISLEGTLLSIDEDGQLQEQQKERSRRHT